MSHPTLPYGAWPSPWSAERIVAATRSLAEPQLDGATLHWLEGRPSEGGRQVLMAQQAGQTQEWLPAPYNARSRVHEYGGGSYTVADGVGYFCEFSDQGIYRLQDAQVSPLLVVPGLRFADFQVDRGRRRLLAVCEDHRAEGEPRNTLVSIPLDGSASLPQELHAGADFYSSPRLSPDGQQLAWLSWQHPWMPWDASELWLAELDAQGQLHNPRRVAGGAQESLCEPRWSPAGVLHVVSDRQGWWNLYAYHGGDLQPCCLREAEFAAPHWQFAQRHYGFDSQGQAICLYTQDGRWYLARLTGAEQLQDIPLPYSDLSALSVHKDQAYLLAGAPDNPPVILQVDLLSGAHRVLVQGATLAVDPGYIAIPQSVYFATQQGRQAHAFFYPPTNPDYRAPAGEQPPVLVKGHGGPTSTTSSTLNPGIQFWTSRGFAVLDVNYGGSTGFGRAYHQRLDGQWGVVDVEDCVNAVHHAAAQGWVDGQRCAIRGGSAGGYTALAALCFHDTFSAGASHYGISDLETLAQDTHKFESRYLERLIGPYPQRQALYQARSPIHHLEGFSTPAIFFQGLEDRVVPPNQAQRMVEALRQRGVPVAYVPFPGEGHGFRQATNIRRCLEAELYFYGRIFGFSPADAPEPVTIHHLCD